MEDKVNIEISQGLIKPIIEQKIKTSIFDALGGKENVLTETLIDKIASTKVNSDGNVSSYSSDNKYNYLDMICVNAIKKSMKEGIREWVENNKKTLQDEVKKYIMKTPSKFAKVLVNGFEESLNKYFNFSVNMKFDKRD